MQNSWAKVVVEIIAEALKETTTNCQLMPIQKGNFDILELRFTRQEEMFE